MTVLLLFSRIPRGKTAFFAAICIVKKKIFSLYAAALRRTFFRIIIKVTPLADAAV
ncbi:hypothetical protein [Undibacterium terreum]|uniref:hypothetical protein n=1 Tax=Undibacterium terreum TaxID=1224302 RepID=UPI001668F65E|nr:hypothetical protein [Undibacterium terreum]